jgi:hypothetical protein
MVERIAHRGEIKRCGVGARKDFVALCGGELHDPILHRESGVAARNRPLTVSAVTRDSAWRKVKPFKGVDAARLRYLTGAQARRLVNAADPDFRQAALQTGCRYGELAPLEVWTSIPAVERWRSVSPNPAGHGTSC